MAPPGGGQQPLQAPVPVAAMQEPETLRSPPGAGDISLDMPRLYSKHQLPALSYYGTLAARAHTLVSAKPAHCRCGLCMM